MATASVSTAPVKLEMFTFRIIKLILKYGGIVYRKCLERRANYAQGSLHKHLMKKKSDIQLLINKYITQEQFDKIFPQGQAVTTANDFDITLLASLIRNTCPCEKQQDADEKKKWNHKNIADLSDNDLSETSDLIRIRIFRNQCAHFQDTVQYDEVTFNSKWQEIAKVLIRQCPNLKSEIDELKVCPLDTDLQIELEQLKYQTNDLYQRVKNLETNASISKLLTPQVIRETEEVNWQKHENTNLQLQHIYGRAIQEGFELDKHIRVIIVGNVAHGKTTLTRLLLGQNLDGIESTNGIYLNVNYCTNSETGQWESIPDEDLDPIVRMAQESDLLKENTEFITHEPKHILVPINSTFQPFKDAFTKRSATDNSSNKFTISIWDFGGHLSFYATHQLFHSRNAIYLLVTNLSTDLDDKMHDIGFNQEENLDNRKCLQFWVDSIHSHVGSANGKEPPIFLVGTFMDLQENKEKAKQYMLDIRKMFSETNTQRHIQKEDFAIGKTCKYESEIAKLRKAIVDKFQRTNRIKTPLKWIPLERAVKKIRGKPIITIDELSKHDKSTGSLLENMEQLKAFLLFHHGKGTFIYYDEELLSNYIVIQPKYLIDSFKAIITSEHFWKMDPDLDPDLHPDWKKLYKEAHLTMEFLDSCWGQSECKFLEQKEILILFLERSRIISQVFVLNENTNEKEYLKFFLVPSLLKMQIPHVDLTEFLIERESTMVSMVYKFRKSGIVPTAYQRLTAAALGQWPVVEYKRRCMIFKDVGMYLLNDTYVGIINVKNDMIELRVINLCGKFVAGSHGDKFRRFAEFIIENEFGKLRSCVQNSEIFQKYVRCFVDNHKTNGSEKLYQLDQLTGDIKPCPDFLTHNISVTKALNEWFLKSVNITNLSSVMLSEKHCAKLANAIGSNWEHFAISFLNMDRVQVEHITVDNPDNIKHQIMKMLTAWKQSQPSGGTLKKLSEALQMCESEGGITVNWSVIKNINDGFQ